MERKKHIAVVPSKPKEPDIRPSLLDSKFRYVPAAATDIRNTWAKFGWKPVERKEHYND
jgi:hypothetical protein